MEKVLIADRQIVRTNWFTRDAAESAFVVTRARLHTHNQLCSQAQAPWLRDAGTDSETIEGLRFSPRPVCVVPCLEDNLGKHFSDRRTQDSSIQTIPIITFLNFLFLYPPSTGNSRLGSFQQPFQLRTMTGGTGQTIDTSSHSFQLLHRWL